MIPALLRTLLIAALLVAPLTARADPDVPMPDGYRTEPYGGPTPDAVPGGHVARTTDVQAMLAAGHVALIDVLTAPRRPEGMRADAPWMPVPRRDLPGSVWLPDVGRGTISEDVEAYFRANLERATGGDKGAAVVFYCRAHCWLGWNATKRAANLGWRNAYWYPDGTDGWEEAGLPLQETRPEPLS